MPRQTHAAGLIGCHHRIGRTVVAISLVLQQMRQTFAHSVQKHHIVTAIRSCKGALAVEHGVTLNALTTVGGPYLVVAADRDAGLTGGVVGRAGGTGLAGAGNVEETVGADTA